MIYVHNEKCTQVNYEVALQGGSFNSKLMNIMKQFAKTVLSAEGGSNTVTLQTC